MTMHETPVALRVEGLNAWYGRAQALFDVSVELRPREMVAVLGRNGAGKSTLMRAIAGAGVRRSGSIRLGGDHEIIRAATNRIARAGVSWVPDSRRVFATLSVRENLSLARRANKRPNRPSVDDMVDAFPMLGRLLSRSGSELSGGEQQVAAIARGLISGPSVLLVDEPTEGLAPTIVEQLVRALRELPQEFDVSVLVAEENVRVLLELTDTIYALDVGRIVLDPRTASKKIRNLDDALDVLGLTADPATSVKGRS